MLQRSSLTTPTATEIAGTLQQTLERSALRSLQNTLQLPVTWQQYLTMLGVVLVLAIGLAVDVLLTVQTAEAEATVRALRSDYAWIQYENSELIHQIATQSSLSEVQRRAAVLNYIPATSRTFVYRSDAPAMASAATLTAPPDETGAPAIHVQPGAAAPAPTPVTVATPAPQPWWEAAPAWFTTQLNKLVPAATGQGGADDGVSSP